jgi:hypothetical protein
MFPQLQTDMAHRHKVELELAAAGKTVWQRIQSIWVCVGRFVGHVTWEGVGGDQTLYHDGPPAQEAEIMEAIANGMAEEMAKMTVTPGVWPVQYLAAEYPTQAAIVVVVVGRGEGHTRVDAQGMQRQTRTRRRRARRPMGRRAARVAMRDWTASSCTTKSARRRSGECVAVPSPSPGQYVCGGAHVAGVVGSSLHGAQ